MTAQGPFWIVGCGAMAGAMLSRWLDLGTLTPDQVTVIDPALPKVDGVRTLAAVPDGPPPAYLLLGVKPQLLAAVAGDVARASGAGTSLLSILAGTTHATLSKLFPTAKQIVRVMPNLPVAIGEGAVVLYAPAANRAPLDALMAPLGLVEWVEDEALLDVVTALSGSGPAFVYRFAEAMAKGAAALGLDLAQADRLARATVAGAAALAKASPDSLATLADRVASKGGTTRAGLDVVDDAAALDRLIGATLDAAARRSRELAKGG